MNIFHKLAESAFEGRYDPPTCSVVARDLGSDLAALTLWSCVIIQYFEDYHVYYKMNRKQKALALLFIGEMYESSL